MDRYASTRNWNDDPHLVGMVGEIALTDFYGALLDTRYKPGGDKGVDLEAFMTITGKFEWIKQDVKTARFPKELWTGVDLSPTKPDCIYLLARYIGGWEAELLRWEWGHEMMKCPKKSEGGRLVYYKPQHLLRPLSELKEYYCKRWRWFEDENAPPRGHPAEYPVARPEIKDNPFHGWCEKCDAPGLYYADSKWFCNTHRVW
jgi:hypothetical protein